MTVRDDPPLGPSPAWASSAGLLDFGDGEVAADVEVVADRLRIMECAYRYTWGFDERRTDMLERCFTEDAVWEGLVMGSYRIGPFTGRREVLAWLTNFWQYQRDQRRHMMLNPIIGRQERTEATLYSYVLLAGSRKEQLKIDTTGFYRFDLRREDDGWRITRMFAGLDAPNWPGSFADLSPKSIEILGVSEVPSN